jgi:site-specific DNA-methyltransferase (adenine-specific)
LTEAVDPIAKENSRLSKEEWREYTKTVWHIANTTDSAHPAVFPTEIPKRLIKLFSFYGETVLDPFAGAGTTARAALTLGRKAICVEQSKKYATRIRAITRSLDSIALQTGALRVVQADSRYLDFLPDDSIDLIVTSPPYWNKARYGDSPENLGEIENYVEFLDAIRPAFLELFRVLRPGRKLCVVTANVNQHTDRGLLSFPIPADFTVMLRTLGFVMVNEVIWSKDKTGGRWGSANQQRPIFGSYPYPPNFLFKTVHEHILIFAKPNSHSVRGPKVIPYGELMSIRMTSGQGPHARPNRERANSRPGKV